MSRVRRSSDRAIPPYKHIIETVTITQITPSQRSFKMLARRSGQMRSRGFSMYSFRNPLLVLPDLFYGSS
jgi:hypothetical protein